VKPLPRGATPVDFAYTIHTDVGHQCVGARVNGRMVPLRTPLNNGDIVEIITQKNHRPSRDWLNFVVTSKARNKIRHHLQGEERARGIEIARKLLEKEGRRFDLNIRTLLADEMLQKAGAAFGMQSIDELLAAVGYGKLQARQVLAKLVPDEQLQERDEKAQSGMLAAVRRVFSGAGDRIKVRGADDMLVFRARCCNPIRGEKIVGYITRGKGVSVHAVTCPNVLNLMYDPDRRIDVAWDSDAGEARYSVRLTLEVEDRRGMLAEVSARVAGVDTNITKIEALTSTDDNRGRIDMTIEIGDLKQLEKVVKSLKKVGGVLSVERSAK
jgi:guanosine-3',5'-bis(diphosphate) 3'-pyrophosphohydrolase